MSNKLPQTLPIVRQATRFSFLLIVFIIHQCIGYGQDGGNAAGLRTLTKLDLGLQGIGAAYEPRLSKSLVSELSLGFGGGYNIGEGSVDIYVIKPAMYFSVTPKLYYNIKKRIEKGKPTANNSGNYFGARLKFNTPLYRKSGIIRNSVLSNIHWGLQRSVGERWSFNSHIGAGYAHDIDHGFGTIYPALDVKFSYIIK